MTETNFKIGDYTVSMLDYLDVFRRDDGLLDFRLEELTSFNMNMNEESSEIKGKNNNTIGHKKSNKTTTGSGSSGIISMGLMKAQTGGEIETGEMEIKKSETKVISGAGTAVVTDYTAIGTEGNEIGVIQLFNEKSICVKKYEQGTAATEDKFSYDPDTKTINLPNDPDIKSGMSILYAYTRTVKGMSVNNPYDKYSEVREMWFHCFGEDTCDTTWNIAIWIPRADITGEFGLAFGEDQTMHEFNFNALPDLCNKHVGSNLWKYFVYQDEPSGEGSSGTPTQSDVFATEDEVRKVFTD